MLDKELIIDYLDGQPIFIVRDYLTGQQTVFMEELLAVHALLEA